MSFQPHPFPTPDLRQLLFLNLFLLLHEVHRVVVDHVQRQLLQPVPPPYVWTDGNGDKVDAYLRFKNMYLNEIRLEQPVLILDVILRAPPANAAELLESAPPPTVSTSPFGLVEP